MSQSTRAEELRKDAKINDLYARKASETFEKTGRSSAQHSCLIHEREAARKRRLADDLEKSGDQ